MPKVTYPSRCIICNNRLQVGPDGARIDIRICPRCDEERIRELGVKDANEIISRLCSDEDLSPVEAVNRIFREMAIARRKFYADLKKEYTDDRGWLNKRKYRNELKALNADWYSSSYVSRLRQLKREASQQLGDGRESE